MTTAMLQDRVDDRRIELDDVRRQARAETRKAVLETLGRAPGADAIPIPRLEQQTVGGAQRYDSETEKAAMHARNAATRAQAIEASISRYEVEIHKKYALAFACVVFVLLGAPLAVRFPRGGLGLVIAASSGIFAISWMGLIGGENLADRGIAPPAVAMWTPNLIFLLIGFWLASRMGREAATMRGGGWDDLFWTLRAFVGRGGPAFHTRPGTHLMRILDRLVARTFFRIFVLSIFATPPLFILADVTENLDRYLDRGLTGAQVVAAYAWMLPLYIQWSFPIAALVARGVHRPQHDHPP